MAWLKRLAVPKWWPIEKKTHKFALVPRGPHPKMESLPLSIIIRDVLKFAETAKEARSVIKRGEVLVDGRKIKDPNFGIGLFDVIEIPVAKKSFRIIPSKSGFELLEINDSKLKICKIIDKKILKKNKIQLNLDCGKNIIVDKQYPTGDSLLLELPDQKIIEHYKLDKNSIVIVVKGSNAGLISKIKEMEKDRVWLEVDNQSIEVPKNYVVAVGGDKAAIKLK